MGLYPALHQHDKHNNIIVIVVFIIVSIIIMFCCYSSFVYIISILLRASLQIPKDAHILRFLKAREFNIEKSREMLVHSLAWRKLHGVDSLLENISTPDVMKQYFTGAWHYNDLGTRLVPAQHTCTVYWAHFLLRQIEQ